jgi:hypothetical protein
MLMLVNAIGALIIIGSCIFLVFPKAMKSYLDFLSLGRRVYLLGILRFMLGGCLLVAAKQARFQGILTVLGTVTIMGAVLIFFLKDQQIKAILGWYQKRSILSTRLLACLMAALGILILYSV